MKPPEFFWCLQLETIAYIVQISAKITSLFRSDKRTKESLIKKGNNTNSILIGWDESFGVIRPTVEVEEFYQSCPRAAHPHTAYVNILYVYPLSLNYSNQKVFSKVNLDYKCKCKMLMLC